MATDLAVPRLTYLRIKNYRALRDVEFRDLTPLTVLIGPNGSGKSTVLDALDFLAEAVRGNMQQAWEKRDRFRGMRTRGSEGAIEFEVEIQLNNLRPQLRYRLVVDEVYGTVFVSDESLTELGVEENKILYLDSAEANPLREQGYEYVLRINGYSHDGITGYSSSPSSTPFIARMGFFPNEIGSRWPLVLSVVEFLTSYRLLHLTDNHFKGYSDQGPRELLSPSGDNLPNVLYHLHLKYPEVLTRITRKLRDWVPWLTDIVTEITSDERLLLRLKDAPFEKPLSAQYMSEGTMRLVVLLTLLYEPNAEGFLGIEEPETALHPRLPLLLSEELIMATEHRQLLVATHSPFLLDALEPEQVWILHRSADGYTQATRAANIPHVKELVEDGSPLGYLWSSNSLPVADPLKSSSTAPDAR